jgi:hypothetical protein
MDEDVLSTLLLRISILEKHSKEQDMKIKDLNDVISSLVNASKSEKDKTSLQVLPDEIVFHIVGYMEDYFILQLLCCSKRFHHILYEDKIWRERLKRRFGFLLIIYFQYLHEHLVQMYH